MDGKTLRLARLLIVIGVAIFLGLLWQPSRQVRLHQRHLLRAVEKRDWAAAGRFIDAEYHDRWGHDKENVLPEAAQVFSQFFLCNIQADERPLEIANGVATLRARLTLGGSGSPIAEMAKEHVNALTEPFEFTWTHRSWKPWDWTLIETSQSQLRIEESSF